MKNIENNQEEEKNVEIKDNSKRAKTLLTVFWILISFALLGVLSDYNELQILKSIQNGYYVSEEKANLSDLFQVILGIIQFGLFITSAVVFLNWFRRAYGNLHRIGITYIRHKESMAVWTWFIPIIWFYRPVQIMYEIWTETQEKIKKFDSSYVLKSGGLLIGLWWALFIISNFIGRYILKTAFKQDTIDQIIESSQAILISDIMLIPEALLVIIIVQKISKMESKLVDEVIKSGGKVISD